MQVCSGSNVSCEDNLRATTLGEWVIPARKVDYCYIEHAFSSSNCYPVLAFITISFASWKIKFPLIVVAIHLLPTMLMSCSDLSPAIRPLILSSKTIIYWMQNHFNATRWRTVDIALPSRIAKQYDTSSEIHLHFSTSRIFSTKRFSYYSCSGFINAFIFLWRPLIFFSRLEILVNT